jgi:hypothetical protein
MKQPERALKLFNDLKSLKNLLLFPEAVFEYSNQHCQILL